MNTVFDQAASKTRRVASEAARIAVSCKRGFIECSPEPLHTLLLKIDASERVSFSKLFGLVLGPVLLCFVMDAPMALTPTQHHLLALICLTITYWVFRPVPIAVSGMLTLALAVVLQVAPGTVVFSAFSSPTLFLLLGSFIITQSMIKHGLGKRIALGLLSMPFVVNSTYRVIIAFGIVAALLSTVLDNGAVAAILLPISMGFIKLFADDIRDEKNLPDNAGPLRFSTALMLMVGYGSTVGALLTPLGDASNLVGWHFIQQEFHVRLPVGTWVVLAMPIVFALFIVLAAVVLFFNKPEIHHVPHAREQVAESRRDLGPMSSGEINTAIVFVLAVIFWLLPSVVAAFTSHDARIYEEFSSRLSPATVAVLSSALLFVLPVGWRKKEKRGVTMKWDDVTRMNWGPIVLVGSTLALGTLMAHTGLASALGHALAARATGVGAMGVYFFAAAVAIMFSELSTNLVSITVLVPIIPPLAAAGGGQPLEAALVATFAAIYGFMLPISTSANAIIYGSGKVPFWKMLKTGFWVDVSGLVIVVLGLHFMLYFVHVT